MPFVFLLSWTACNPFFSLCVYHFLDFKLSLYIKDMNMTIFFILLTFHFVCLFCLFTHPTDKFFSFFYF